MWCRGGTMDAQYLMARDTRLWSQREKAGSDVLPCPAGEPPAVEAQWTALASTCDGVTAGDVVMLLELARCLADLEEARRNVTEAGAFVLTKSGDMTENPWCARERTLRAQALQLRKSLPCLGSKVAPAPVVAAAEEARAAAAAEEERKAAAAKAKRAEAAERRRAKREAAK